MSVCKTISMTRKQLYVEIWSISVAGVARKYNVSYSGLMKQIKDSGIPIPSSGYWIKLEFNKPVKKSALPGNTDETITLDIVTKPKRTNPSEPGNAEGVSVEAEDINSGLIQTSGKTETQIYHGQSFNVYDRKTLYEEIWALPVTKIAEKYRVSNVAIHKVCKSLNIPTPPRGYWAKLYTGKPVKQIPLPETKGRTRKNGIRTNKPAIESETLDFLEEEDRIVVLAVAANISLPDENVRMHPKIVAHRKLLAEWNRKQNSYDSYRGRRNQDTPPFLVTTVSKETAVRVYHILDALIKALEPLGCTLTDNLNFVVNGETVSVSATEAKDKVEHVITKAEHMQLLEYEDNVRMKRWASKPNIRKYDQVYNGRTTFSILGLFSFRDCKSYVIEDRLGDIMISLYKASNIERLRKEAAAEAERKRKEEARRREERRVRYNAEIDKTIELVNEAYDYEIASRIRKYIAAVEANDQQDEQTIEWLEWAKGKADWFDPMIAKDDENLGKRDHKKDQGLKKLEHMGYSYW